MPAIWWNSYEFCDELVAQVYMLISMPTGNSRIFGAFQNIFHPVFFSREQVAPNANPSACMTQGLTCQVRSLS
jgi:hypothetical protein